MQVVFVTVLFHAPDWNNLDSVFDVLTLVFMEVLLWLGGTLRAKPLCKQCQSQPYA